MASTADVTGDAREHSTRTERRGQHARRTAGLGDRSDEHPGGPGPRRREPRRDDAGGREPPDRRRPGTELEKTPARSGSTRRRTLEAIEADLTGDGWEREGFSNTNDQMVLVAMSRGEDENLNVTVLADETEAMLTIIYVRPT
jgi:hypothetical protein